MKEHFFNFYKKKETPPTVSFATSVWERDWKQVLYDENYLSQKLIGNHCHEFNEKILIINNVKDIEAVKKQVQKLVEKKIFTRFVSSQDIATEVLNFFHLKRESFKGEDQNARFEIVNSDWIYFNALAPLSAIYICPTDYLLYITADVYMKKPVSWIEKAIKRMQRKRIYKVANLVWNDKYDEAKKESYKTEKNFFVAKEGFSDQCFLIGMEDFKNPVYSEIREDASHYPRGDVFEKRVYSFMKNRQWKRITYRHGSYTHENIS